VHRLFSGAGLLLVLLIPACGSDRKAAVAALDEVEMSYAVIQEEARKVAPDQSASIETTLAAARARLDAREHAAVLAGMRELGPRVKELSDRLPGMRSELEYTWKSLNSSVPGTLASLRQRLRPANRPPYGTSRQRFDAARNTLLDLAEDWDSALVAMSGGRLAEAVSKGEQVKSRAVGLATGVHEGS